MSPAKQLLLSAYYYGSYPERAWRNARWRRAGNAPAMILFYHRIANGPKNDWTATPATFTKQIDWLERHFDLVSLAEVQRRVRSGRNTRPAVAITFDDGYAENCDHALPLLISKRIPCTYFVSTQHVLRQKPFPHDVSLGRPLAPNTPDQIRQISSLGIELGVHTRTHADLGKITDSAELLDEVVVAREELAELTGVVPRYFAFPYGQHRNLNREVFSLAREVGYEGLCSAYGGFNFPGDDAFHLQRIHADDDLIRLKNWVTVDPRKLRSIERYDYQPPQPAQELAQVPA